MSIPKEPRQIMINLMYLVLTALLALNVSNEILNAFKTLSSSLDKSNVSIDLKTAEIYNQIIASEKEKGQAEKVRPYREKADIIVKKSDEMVAYLNNWKRRVVIEAGGYGKEGEDTVFPDKMDNIDATTSLLVERKGGDTLRQKILELRKFLLEMVPGDSAGMSRLMPLNIQMPKKNDHNPTGDWNIANFEHMPAIASLALFSKFQNDVRSSEAMVIKRLSELAHTRDLKYDTTAAVAVPKTTYALVGDKIEATILLAAFNTNNQPTVNISQGGGTKKPAKNGVIEWETVASGTGLQTVKGTVSLETSEQGTITRPWSFDYMVGTTGASMGLDKMNVMYIGVDNPVTVSAAGYAIEDVTLSVPSGVTQSGSNGHFIINCTTPNPNMTIDIMAKAKGKDGGPVKVGSTNIRVKYIPDPVAVLLGKSSGTMSASLFRNAIAPEARLEKFEFDTKFQVIEFQYSMVKKGEDYIPPITVHKDGGVRLSDNPEVARQQSKAKIGDRVILENIKCIGPDKKVRTLNTILLTLN